MPTASTQYVIKKPHENDNVDLMLNSAVFKTLILAARADAVWYVRTQIMVHFTKIVRSIRNHSHIPALLV